MLLKLNYIIKADSSLSPNVSGPQCSLLGLSLFCLFRGKRGGVCAGGVGNGSHFCTPVLIRPINMCNITFEVPLFEVLRLAYIQMVEISSQVTPKSSRPTYILAPLPARPTTDSPHY